MVSGSKYRCWKIMNCDNLDFLDRLEPEAPYWQLAQKIETFHKGLPQTFSLSGAAPLLLSNHFVKGEQICTEQFLQFWLE
jgi:hypothetical protein